MIHIVCVNKGNYSGAGQRYVETLHAMVARNVSASTPYHFICFTDDEAAYRHPIRQELLPPGLKNDFEVLYLFEAGRFHPDDLVLFLNLDTLITGPLDPILQYTGSFAILRHFYRPQGYWPAVIMWRGSGNAHLWQTYQAAGQPGTGGGAQVWIEKNRPSQVDLLQDIYPGQFRRFEAHRRDIMPADAAVISFSGPPRPHQVKSGWVPQVWRTNSESIGAKPAPSPPPKPDTPPSITLKIHDWARVFLTASRERVILVANSPALPEGIVESLEIRPHDAIVQFNKAPFFETFKNVDCHKVHVFNYGAGKWWGFSSEDQPSHDYGDQSSESLTFLFRNYLSPGIKAFLAGLRDVASGGLINPKDVPNSSYSDSKSPSIGFVTISYFRYVNMLRFLMSMPPLDLVMLGFSGKYPPGKAWNGHDFKFEQRVYDTWLDLKRIETNQVV